MSSGNPIQRFEDILENIALIEQFTKGMNAQSFREDPMASNAVERCLERISEAARKLGDAANEFCLAFHGHPGEQLEIFSARVRQSRDQPHMGDDRRRSPRAQSVRSFCAHSTSEQ